MKIVRNFILLTMSIFTLSCADKLQLDLENSDAKYYYCAYVSYLKLTMDGPIRSLERFNERIGYLDKLDPKEDAKHIKNYDTKFYVGKDYDANYYKVVSENNKKVVYGYSMLTNKLKELIKLNEKGWIESKQMFEGEFNQIKECHWTYDKKEKMMIITKECDDNSKYISHYPDGENSTDWEFKNNKLIKLFVPSRDGNSNYVYDGNGTWLGSWNIMAEGDKCIPFKPYLIDKK